VGEQMRAFQARAAHFASPMNRQAAQAQWQAQGPGAREAQENALNAAYHAAMGKK
jgi:hypothetical protein